MQLSEQYARALRELVAKNPDRASHYFRNLRGVLARRGHEKLLRRVVDSYTALEVGAERQARAGLSTKEERRMRMLVELYRKLISS
ncbi:MAG: hypothetical protein ACREGH_02215 [Minisyncoccia bacterium]